MSTSVISFDTAEAASSSLDLAAILFGNMVFCIFLVLSLILLAELWTEVIGNALEEGRHDPGGKAHHAGNQPVVSMETSFSDLHSITTELNNNTLCS